MKSLRFLGLSLLLAACVPLTPAATPAETVNTAIGRGDDARLYLERDAGARKIVFDAGATKALNATIIISGDNITINDPHCIWVQKDVVCRMGDLTGVNKIALSGDYISASIRFGRQNGFRGFLVTD